MLQGRVCKAGCPGWIQRRVCKVLGRPPGAEKRANPDLAPGGGKWYFIRENRALQAQRGCDVPNFTVLYWGPALKSSLSPLPGPLI